MRCATLSLCLCLAGAAAPALAQIDQKPVLTLEGARMALAAATAEAQRLNARGAIAVVDDGGHLLAFVRLDGTFPAGSEVSIGKARTAAIFRKPTAAFEESVNKGRYAMLGLPDFFTPLQGGVPIVHDGHVVGGIGVSGANSAMQDEEIAMAGAAGHEPSGARHGAAPADEPMTIEVVQASIPAGTVLTLLGASLALTRRRR